MNQEFITFDADQIHVLKESATFKLQALGPAPAVLNQVHLTQAGDVLSTSASSVGGEGNVVLHGALGPIPYDFSLKVKLEDTKIIVTFDLNKPLDMPPYTWTFALGGVSQDPSGKVMGARDIKLDYEATPAFLVAGAPQVAAARPVLCILKCGGMAMLPVLLKCLPALIGGPQAFIACVVGSAGEAAAAIAACVAGCLGMPT
jgi:hypothetical protein